MPPMKVGFTKQCRLMQADDLFAGLLSPSLAPPRLRMIALHAIAGTVVDWAFLDPGDEFGDSFVLQQFLDGVVVASEFNFGKQ